MAKEERKKNHDKPSATTWNSKWNSKWNVQHVIGPCSAAKFKINCSHSQLLAMVFACLFVCTYVSSVTINFFSTFFFFRDDFRVVFGAPFVFAFDRYDLYSFSNSMMPRTIHNCLELFNQQLVSASSFSRPLILLSLSIFCLFPLVNGLNCNVYFSSVHTGSMVDRI